MSGESYIILFVIFVCVCVCVRVCVHVCVCDPHPGLVRLGLAKVSWEPCQQQSLVLPKRGGNGLTHQPHQHVL